MVGLKELWRILLWDSILKFVSNHSEHASTAHLAIVYL